MQTLNRAKSESASYEGSGKTTVSILNQEVNFLMVNAYGRYGFKLNSGTRIIGPTIILPTSVMAWVVSGPQDINLRSMAFFRLLNPTPDIVFLGAGNSTRDVDTREIINIRKHGIKVEVLPTHHAVSSYNFLCAEGRAVAAALLPPERVEGLNEKGEIESNHADTVHTITSLETFFQTLSFPIEKLPRNISQPFGKINTTNE